MRFFTKVSDILSQNCGIIYGSLAFAILNKY